MSDHATSPLRFRLRRDVAIGCLLALLLSAFPLTVDAASGGKTEVLPVQKAAPSAVFIETTGPEADLRRQLRAKNAVAELGASASQVMFSQAPTGSYGFIEPKFLGMALVTQSPDLVLQRAAPTANAYEIHKLADGSGMVVGYVEKELMVQVAPAQRPKTVRLELYSNPSAKAAHIVAVPLTKLSSDRMPTKIDPKNPNSPVVLNMDLRSSASHASTQGVQ